MNKDYFKFALYGAIIVVVYRIIIHSGGVDWLMSLPLSLTHYIIVIAIMVMALIRRRNSSAKELSPKDTFLGSFIAGAVVSFVSGITTSMMYYFNPDSKQELINFQKEAFARTLREKNIDEETIANSIAQKDQITNETSIFVETFQIILIDIIIVAIIAVILGMIIKPKSQKITFE